VRHCRSTVTPPTAPRRLWERLAASRNYWQLVEPHLSCSVGGNSENYCQVLIRGATLRAPSTQSQPECMLPWPALLPVPRTWITGFEAHLLSAIALVTARCHRTLDAPNSKPSEPCLRTRTPRPGRVHALNSSAASSTFVGVTTVATFDFRRHAPGWQANVTPPPHSRSLSQFRAPRGADATRGHCQKVCLASCEPLGGCLPQAACTRRTRCRPAERTRRHLAEHTTRYGIGSPTRRIRQDTAGSHSGWHCIGNRRSRVGAVIVSTHRDCVAPQRQGPVEIGRLDSAGSRDASGHCQLTSTRSQEPEGARGQYR